MKYLETLEKIYEPIYKKINKNMSPNGALILGTGLTLCGIGQILFSVVSKGSSLETTIGAVFIAGGSLCLGSGAKYYHSKPDGRAII